MKTNLVVNPLAAIDFIEETGDFKSGGPVPGRGMKYLQVSASSPSLYSLFRELSSIGLGNLDIQKDLNEAEVELLCEYGILVDAANAPERPLFACMLDDVEDTPLISGPLIVNPTLEFQPFDLTKFRHWIRDKHLSPHFATAWVTDPETEMRWGYWLDAGQAELIAELRPGGGFSETSGPAVAKLLSASILLDRSKNQPRSIADKALVFARDRYTVIDDVLPRAQFRALQGYYRRYVEQGFMVLGDEFVSRRYSEHGEHIAFRMLNNLTPLMSRLARIPVIPTYSHSAVYIEGADLEPHVDREACEYSFSFQLDYYPLPGDGVSPWPLYISVDGPDDWRVNTNIDTAICLANGSCLAYRGRELVHYRTPLPPGHRSSSLFFHYIPA